MGEEVAGVGGGIGLHGDPVVVGPIHFVQGGLWTSEVRTSTAHACCAVCTSHGPTVAREVPPCARLRLAPVGMTGRTVIRGLAPAVLVQPGGTWSQPRRGG